MILREFATHWCPNIFIFASRCARILRGMRQSSSRHPFLNGIPLRFFERRAEKGSREWRIFDAVRDERADNYPYEYSARRAARKRTGDDVNKTQPAVRASRFI
ncbi:hypothetical protein COU20_02030 [Candidatus Kaiserbacteria bacterium CG10_big_fil_rev_8_21_14_0_10_59_10]|uniref:Uncharacterized protein n=1 Tax=Candidatus Kaiserbacteria bacterium CG10_big_fil_rev_8_21_14_0_10_59_10 TaxID=1974612 RepID=A0A2H0UA30_9BACT|nr:MAG: hypothetical protein COU20_02030 [Candidatus Kaiserbacteria bacterium CG10_big_fil_rev_8_21_14_0_10_59_10]